MQLLARLMDHVLAERGQRATIVGATSGDTGGAAIDAFAGREPHRHLHPVPARPRLAGAAAADDDVEGRKRPCAGDRRQFRRLPGPGEGHVQRPRLPRPGVRCRASTRSTGRASWPRSSIIFSSALSLGARTGRSRFTVPTGNFGDIFAGYAAKRWACRSSGWSSPPTTTTSWRARFATGEYRTKGVVATTSPSMDIQVSSNFERLLFEASRPRRRDRAALHGRPEAVRRLHHRSRKSLGASAPNSTPAAPTMDEVAATIRSTLAASGYLLDPHTATAVHVARRQGCRRHVRWSCSARRIRQNFRPPSKPPAASRRPCPHG